MEKFKPFNLNYSPLTQKKIDSVNGGQPETALKEQLENRAEVMLLKN